MSDSYIAFIREVRRRLIELNLTPHDAAGYILVSKHTFYNWLACKTVMSGEDMLRIIDIFMGGKYEKRRTL